MDYYERRITTTMDYLDDGLLDDGILRHMLHGASIFGTQIGFKEIF
jgi:hypothetical protein